MNDRRKLVKSGNTSYTVALPIDWIRKQSLDKGSEVVMNETQAGDLVISSKETPAKVEGIRTIKVNNKSSEEIELDLISAYLSDCSTIIFEGEMRHYAKIIAEKVKSLIGLDLIEQSQSHIMVKNFFVLDDEMSPYLLLKKIMFLEHSLFNNLRLFLDNGLTKEDVSEMYHLRDQSERLLNLMRKIINKLYEQPQLLRTTGLSASDLAKYKLISFNLKNISVLLGALGNALLLIESTRRNQHLKTIIAALAEEFDIVAAAMVKRNAEGLKKYICAEEKTEAERHLQDSSNPAILQALHHSSAIKLLLKDIAFQLLE